MRYIALLRGINVGGHNAKMDILKAEFVDLGFSNISSYIASGNIFFDSDEPDKTKLELVIETKLEQKLGFSVPTFLRTQPELKQVIDQAPFKVEPKAEERQVVVFTKSPMNTDLTLPIESTKADMQIAQISSSEAYIIWKIINKRPPSGKFSPEVLPAENTSRFFHTLKKIYAASKA